MPAMPKPLRLLLLLLLVCAAKPDRCCPCSLHALLPGGSNGLQRLIGQTLRIVAGLDPAV